MKRALALIAGAALLALGVWSAVALGAGNDQRETSTVATTTTTTTTGETGETADTATGETIDSTTVETTGETAGETTASTTGETTAETTDTTTGETKDTTAASASKVWVCHHTGSWKHPYHLIHISTHALHAHLRNGDVLPGANNSCPTTQPAEAKIHGHGKGHGARPHGHGNEGQTKATETNDD